MEQENQKIIKICYEGEETFDFNAISPNIEEFVKWVVDNDLLNASKFKVSSNIEEFDIHTFEEIIEEFINSLSSALEMEDTNFEKAMKEVKEDLDPELFDTSREIEEK